MDWLTFTSKLIEALAWPIATVAMVALLRKQIAAALPLVKRLKAGPVEAEFEREVRELAESAQAAPPAAPAEPAQVGFKSELYKLAQVSPRAAILEAWLAVEAAAIAAVRTRSPSTVSDARKPVLLATMLSQNEVLAQGQLAIFQELRSLRNQVVHVSDFYPTLEAVSNYIELATYLKGWLEASASDA